LASGQSIEEDIYSVDFPFDGQTVRAEASFVPGDTILVGTGMLSSYRLVIDFPARAVLLERAAVQYKNHMLSHAAEPSRFGRGYCISHLFELNKRESEEDPFAAKIMAAQRH
jgi:hypothetical protein